jgi:hypothetical protein
MRQGYGEKGKRAKACKDQMNVFGIRYRLRIPMVFGFVALDRFALL